MRGRWAALVKSGAALLLLSVLLSIPLSNLTEHVVAEPAAKLMTLLTSGSTETYRLDARGVPVVYYRRLGAEHYNPVYVSMFGLAYFQAWTGSHEFDYFLSYYPVELPAAGKDAMRIRFLATADWLADALSVKQGDRGAFGVWEYSFPWETYGLGTPWVSGMAQGVGIQVLVRAWMSTGDQKYLAAARLARNAFYETVERGGVTYQEGTNAYWYEEYAAPGATRSYVLNGMEHALIGLYELDQLTGDQEARQLVESGVNSLRARIQDYDAGWWTYYDHRGLLANSKYHPVNVNLTRKLHEITGDPAFLAAYTRWEKYRAPFFTREFVKQRPNYHDLTIFGMNAAALFLVLSLLTLAARRRREKGRRVVHLTSVHAAFDVRIFHKECKTLAAAGYAVSLVVPHDRDEVRDGVTIRAVGRPRGRLERLARTQWQVLRRALSERADLYHFHDPELLPTGILLRLTGARVLFDVHEDLPKQVLSKPWIHPALRLLVSKVAAAALRVGAIFLDGFVAATPAIARACAGSRTETVQNFPVAGELLAPKSSGYDGRPPVVAYVGGLTAIRGAKEMVQAFAQIPPHLGARLVMAGTFSPPALEGDVRHLAGAEQVEFRGWQSREQVRELLQTARVGLVLFHPVPNHLEAQPNKLFEYMSAGIPVIASDFPLWREILQGSGCGLVVDPLRPDEIARAVTWMLAHPEEAGEMGNRGQAAVAARYHWEIEGQKLLSLYEGMIT